MNFGNAPVTAAVVMDAGNEKRGIRNIGYQNINVAAVGSRINPNAFGVEYAAVQ